MAGFRDILRRGRRDVHQHMHVAALYIVEGAEPLPCTVRVHNKFLALGDMKGTSFDYAEREDITPKLILWREEIPQPQRNAIISVEAGEAYQIDHIAPPDDLTITATVIRMSADDAAGLPVPEI
jgi:hypothetical protein